MTWCVFCEIVSGRERASIVAEDELAMAFMDLRQPHGGHVLIVPKGHVETIDAMTDERMNAAVMAMVVRVAAAVRAAFPTGGLSITQANGEAAGQEVPHVHFHIHPRQVGDGLIRIYGERPARPDRSELDRQAETIRSAMAE